MGLRKIIILASVGAAAAAVLAAVGLAVDPQRREAVYPAYPAVLSAQQEDEIIALQKAARQARNAMPEPVAKPTVYPMDNMSLSNVTWRKEGIFLVASFVLTNNGPYAVKDLKITCESSANSGTIVGRNSQTLYDIVKAHTSKQVHDFNMGVIHSQAARSGCRVEDASFVGRTG